MSFIILVVFFVGLALIDGPQWCVDTPSYVNMDFSREPVYPLFLNGLRTLFEKLGISSEAYGLPAYLTMAVVLQSLLWAVATYRLGVFVYDRCRSNMSEGRARFMMILAEALQVMVACLNRFVAKRGSMYSESLMTESLAMPLFVLFTVLLLKSFKEYNLKNCIKLFCLAVIIGSVRKQMLIVVLMWGCCSFVLHILLNNYRSLKKFSYTVIFVVLTIVAITFFDRGYNQAVRGIFASHTGNSRGGLCTLLYTSDAGDAELFKKNEKYPGLRELYIEIINESEGRNLTIAQCDAYEEGAKVFGSEWTQVVSHYADSYDVIGFDVVHPLCNDYVRERFPDLKGAEAELVEDQVEKELFNTLLAGHISRIFKEREADTRYVFLANILKAFVISNANIRPTILIKVSAVIYAFYLALFILYCIRKKDIPLFSFVVITGLAINCVVTGALIFPQPRYMCYSMGLFYLTLFYMALQIVKKD